MTKVKIYAKSILIPLVLGGIVGILISSSIDYDSVQKPFLSPPSMVFPIIWTILYILMGISKGILESKSLVDNNINIIYYVQLFVNLLWPVAFFVLKWRLFAFIWICLLAVLVLYMIIKFYEKNKLSGLLQIPYFIWTVFATYLNLFVYILNK